MESNHAVNSITWPSLCMDLLTKMSDCLNQEIVCNNIRLVCKGWANFPISNIQIENSKPEQLEDEYFEQLLEHIPSASIKSLNISDRYAHILGVSMLLRYCTNLQHLAIRNFEKDHDETLLQDLPQSLKTMYYLYIRTDSPLIPMLPNLEKLVLQGPGREVGTIKFQHFPNLLHLEIYDGHCNLYHVPYLTKLESVKLIHCEFTFWGPFSQTLRILHVEKDFVRCPFYSGTLDELPNLEEVYLTKVHSRMIHDLSDLPSKLRVLHVEDCEQNFPENGMLRLPLLEDLSMMKSSHTQTLDVGGCPNLRTVAFGVWKKEGGIIVGLDRLVHLKSLFIKGDEGCHPSDILFDSTSLESLTLKFISKGEFDVSCFPNLRRLELQSCEEIKVINAPCTNSLEIDINKK